MPPKIQNYVFYTNLKTTNQTSFVKTFNDIYSSEISRLSKFSLPSFTKNFVPSSNDGTYIKTFTTSVVK
jgi:hypothetical protein